MNPKYKASWIAALRSGKFKQGRECLSTAGKHWRYCCLGVLCKIAGVPEMNGHFDREKYGLSPNLKDYFVIDENTHSFLINMNDTHGKSFNEIADWIEENL